MTVRTRFAPSPTGLLHIGNARAALFNYLFARHHKGEFLLRIEDTDRERSTQKAVDVILDGLDWLSLKPDAAPVFQSTCQQRHTEVAQELLARDLAYKCFCTPDELKLMREQAVAQGLPPRYNGFWRDRDPSEAPSGAPFSVRLKAPKEGETVIEDLVQGAVRVVNAEMDDLIILRSDGSPTYLHAVVCDDHDMEITHVIRGDDHLTNTFRQAMIYRAMGWALPQFAHLPLIHGPDGAKLSKGTARNPLLISVRPVICRRLCAIISSASAGAMAMRRSSHGRSRSPFLTLMASGARLPGWITPNSPILMASISERLTPCV